jgi:AraC-like DNA-binding protein
MPLQTYIPSPPLCEFINMFWAWDDYAPPHQKERILPFGMMELTINLADTPMCMMYPHDNFRPHLFHTPFVGGARSEFFVVDTSCPANLLSVWFRAGGALAFFGASASELQNLHLPLNTLWGNFADDLYHQLREAKTTQARFQILEKKLLHRLYSAQPRHRAIDFALNVFRHNDNIGAVVNQIALSSTRFIQIFKEEIGMTPKLFCQVQRFQQAIRHIVQSPTPNWTDIALSCGYYDQSHFINAFYRFSGINPTEYVAQDKEHTSNLVMS